MYLMETMGAVKLAEVLTEMSQEDLAKRLRKIVGKPVHQTTISGWLHGQLPTISMALALRRACGISLQAWTEIVQRGQDGS